jgi:hypothetical protein
MVKIEIRESEGVPICGDGCCHDDGLMIDKIVNGKWDDDEFYQTENKQETERIVELMKWLYGDDNVKFTALKK